MTTVAEIKSFIDKQRIGIECNDESTESEVKIIIRDTVDDEPSETCKRVARELIKTVKDNFGASSVKVDVEVVDEWIDLTFKPV